MIEKYIKGIIYWARALIVFDDLQNGRTMENNAQESNPINTNVRVYDWYSNPSNKGVKVILQIRAREK